MLKLFLGSRLLKFIIDLCLLPIVLFGAPFFFIYRRIGSQRLPISTKVFQKIGVFPIVNHYYEPCFNNKNGNELYLPRCLPGVDFNIEGQMRFLNELNFSDEFELFLSNEKTAKTMLRFNLRNGYFESGDAEFLFQMIRYLKPKKIIEVGCGESTKIIAAALKLNQEKDNSKVKHICIDPNAQSWIEGFDNIEIIKSNVEDVGVEIFKSLDAGDLLFIDSSHVIRSNGDVLFLYLEVIPQLKSGVVCHVHDIFSPRDYPNAWLQEKVLFWNEQYLLEALLTETNKYEVVAALNLLKHSKYEKLLQVAPFLSSDREPASFYFKVN